MDSIKKIAKKDLARLLTEWGQEFSLLTPSMTDGVATMARWDGQDSTFPEWYRNTTVPPKNCFLPGFEVMFSFQKENGSYNIKPPPGDGQKRLLFGVRPCDASALAVLDNVFEDTYEDPYYLDRRRPAILVGLGCTNPYDSCFCTSVGGDPHDPNGLDIMLTDIGPELLARGITGPGKKLLARNSPLSRATKADETRATRTHKSARKRISRRIDTGDIEKRLLATFDDQEYWQKIAQKCISCGICTLLCPTCYCFDINDDMAKGEGTRCRSLDSCSFPMYTKMAMENPRAEKWRRVRNKVCHKYEFYPMLFNRLACTGCGRCIRLCPVNWDITRIIESVPPLT